MLQKKITQVKSATKFLAKDLFIKPLKYGVEFLKSSGKHIQKLLLEW